MPGTVASRLGSRLLAVCTGVLLLSGMAVGAADAQVPAQTAAALAPGAARVWFYRDYEAYGGHSFAPVALNGTPVGYVQPDGGAFYRDVPAGRYHITVASEGTDVNQGKDIDLPPGGEAYVKILSAPNWDSGGDIAQYRRDTFYVSLVPPQIARSELPAHPLTGG